MFVDEITIHARAGKGGDGVALWRHEKGKEFMGPGGGDGGRGGDVYAEAISDIGILAKYRNVKVFEAGNGARGANFSKTGKDGESITILFPVGAVITNKNTGEQYDLVRAGEKVKILAGGKGGLGNERFKSSRNTSPTEHTDGEAGEEADFKVELRLIADVGFVGFPNAGKSSLLNVLTRAKAKVGNYAFTTLEPNLGVLREGDVDIILADIPGLIEGASSGKGLGHAFLRHVHRTKVLLYCIPADTEEPAKAFEILNKELQNFDKALSERPIIIAITKTDLIDAPALAAFKSSFEKSLPKNAPILSITEVSILDDASLPALKKEIAKALATVPAA